MLRAMNRAGFLELERCWLKLRDESCSILRWAVGFFDYFRGLPQHRQDEYGITIYIRIP